MQNEIGWGDLDFVKVEILLRMLNGSLITGVFADVVANRSQY